MSSQSDSVIQALIQDVEPVLKPEPALLGVLTLEDGQRLLVEYEMLVEEGAAKVRDGANLMHFAIHYILENQLWMYERDAGGNQKFFKQDDYLRDLADRKRVSRATIFSNRSTLKVATRGLEFPVEEVQQVGIKPFTVVKQFLEYDRATGEVTGIKGRDVPPDEAKEMARSAVRDLIIIDGRGNNDLDLTPKDLRAAFAERLGVVEADVKFFCVPTVTGGVEIGYNYDGENWKKALLSEDEVPAEVLEKLFERLHILEMM